MSALSAYRVGTRHGELGGVGVGVLAVATDCQVSTPGSTPCPRTPHPRLPGILSIRTLRDRLTTCEVVVMAVERRVLAPLPLHPLLLQQQGQGQQQGQWVPWALCIDCAPSVHGSWR